MWRVKMVCTTALSLLPFLYLLIINGLIAKRIHHNWTVRIVKLDQGHLGMSDPLKLDF